MKRVIVGWFDSNVMHGWQPNSESVNVAVCESIGYLKEDTKEKIVLLQCISNFGFEMGKMAIPKGCIKSIRELRLK